MNVISVKYMGYWEMLNELGLYSMDRKCELPAMLHNWKIMEDLDTNLELKSTIIPELDSTTQFLRSHVHR